MDETKYVELEAKYDASSLPVSDFQAAMQTLGGTSKVVVGLDTFFSNCKRVLRYRRARPLMPFHQSDKSELTYKQRRRNGDISDRTEVNLSLAAEATEQDVRAYLEAMDMHEHFTIVKESWIQHVTTHPAHLITGKGILGSGAGAGIIVHGGSFTGGGVIGVGGSGWPGDNPYQQSYVPPTLPIDRVDAVFALYDVLHEGKIRRFLEVEMEQKGTISTTIATERLEWWKNWIAARWAGLGEPLNTSLYEMYAPRNGLFVPESF